MSLVVKTVFAAVFAVAVMGYLRLKPANHLAPLSDISPEYRGYPSGEWRRNKAGLWMYSETFDAKATGSDGQSPPRAHLLFIHGYAQHAGMFADLVDDLTAAGITVTVMDLQGHGWSEGDRNYVRDFNDHVQDVLDQITLINRAKAESTPLFIMGHSMGGLIAVNIGLRKPKAVKGMVLSAPAMAIDPEINTTTTRTMALFFSTHLPHMPIAGPKIQGAYSDPARVAAAIADKRSCLGQCWTPARTAAEILGNIDDVRAVLPRLKVPFIVLQGTKDVFATPNGADYLYAHAGSTDKTIKVYEGFRHELIHEPDGGKVVTDIINWITDRS
ncbi:hydrolase [Thecamonas trahens ATCC 50062]|uniref:Hydrolase n=1 Tax=Thecamonas trahens ATCC 50062 TaxID=461836 RepID=A0A0L0DUZ6_THETB|nr:hydrolase [Thecamonas trahens ATCC 50062]KNC56017.1 hydrolase [Thecamonas trahens ATCC 50062]|eukprot:XP_013761061.1 hydrolase [Thecamonas trahens ATCC 50062]